jgi:2'-5' RNA ligase
MLALYRPRPGGEARGRGRAQPADLHVTIAYTGKSADVDRKQLRRAAKKLAGRPPVTARISGHARLTGAGDKDVIVALLDSPQLDELHAQAVKQLGKRGIDAAANHGFIPHLTLA